MTRQSAVWIAVLLVAPGALASDRKKNPEESRNSNPGKRVNFYSIEKEIALGKHMAQEVERQARIEPG
jgi:hypothetical protein